MSIVACDPGRVKAAASEIAPCVSPDPPPIQYVYNPDGFEPPEWLPTPLHRHGDCARYFLHCVLTAGVRNRRNAAGFAPLKAALIRPFFAGSVVYRRVKAALLDSHALLCDERYIPGETSKGFAIGPDLRSRRIRRVPIVNRKLAEKLRNRRDSFVPTESFHRHLGRYLREVEIDYPAALDWMLAAGFEQQDELSAQMIRDRQFFFHVCDYGRVHTNLTNLRSELRGFLSHQGRPLVNLDIRNSQPLMFAVALKGEFAGRTMPPDVTRYVDLVQAGKFYDDLMERADVPPERRPAFKRDFFARVFFCRNEPESDAARDFGRIYPNVYAVIRAKKRDDYRALAWELQRTESAVMIGRVARRCMNELPGVFVATIHDSIITVPEAGETIGAIIKREFERAGISPTVNQQRADDNPPIPNPDQEATRKERERQRRSRRRKANQGSQSPHPYDGTLSCKVSGHGMSRVTRPAGKVSG